MKKCAECGNDFEFKTHNQKYCSNQCCRIATNKRIMQKYYEKRDRLNGAERICKVCNAPLSRYNANEICIVCDIKETKASVPKIIGDIENVIAGFEKASRKKSSRN